MCSGAMGRSCENVDFCGLLPASLIQPVMAGVQDTAFLISSSGYSDVGVHLVTLSPDWAGGLCGS